MKRVKEGEYGWGTFYTCMNAYIETYWSYFKNGRRRRIMESMNQTGIQYMYLWKCHNETPI
jgi:hypothetical protein